MFGPRVFGVGASGGVAHHIAGNKYHQHRADIRTNADAQIQDRRQGNASRLKMKVVSGSYISATAGQKRTTMTRQ
eukprot:1094201-Amphidinium_carterae.1